MDKSTNHPFFSIIIPTIGMDGYLFNSIESTINQKFTDLEVIVVDNSQESATYDKINSIIEGFDDERIKYINTDLRERSNARNVGIDNSKGKYICFLDDDDELYEDHLNIIFQKIEDEEFPMAVVRTGMNHLNEDGNIVYQSKHCPEETDPVVFFLDHMVGIHTLCFHQRIFQEIKFHPDYYYFEDTHLLIRVLLKYPFIQIAKHTCIYNKSPKNWEAKKIHDMQKNNVACIEDLFSTKSEELEKHLNVEKWKKYMLQKKYLDYAFIMISKDKKSSLLYFKKSLSMGFSPKLLKRYITYLYKVLTFN